MMLKASALQPLSHGAAQATFWLHIVNGIAKDHETAMRLPIGDELPFETIACFREAKRFRSVLSMCGGNCCRHEHSKYNYHALYHLRPPSFCRMAIQAATNRGPSPDVAAHLEVPFPDPGAALASCCKPSPSGAAPLPQASLTPEVYNHGRAVSIREQP